MEPQFPSLYNSEITSTHKLVCKLNEKSTQPDIYEEICIFKMSFIQAGVTALLAVSSIYNKVSLNRSTIETHLKQGYVLTCDQRYLKNSVFPPRSNDSVFANSVLATTLQNITPVNKKNKLLFIKGRT